MCVYILSVSNGHIMSTCYQIKYSVIPLFLVNTTMSFLFFLASSWDLYVYIESIVLHYGLKKNTRAAVDTVDRQFSVVTRTRSIYQPNLQCCAFYSTMFSKISFNSATQDWTQLCLFEVPTYILISRNLYCIAARFTAGRHHMLFIIYWFNLAVYVTTYA